MGKAKNTPEKFWSLVEKRGDDKCWWWRGSRTRAGYGTFILNGQHTTAHRIAYWLTTGKYAAGLQILHRCDHPSCVNPSHLWIGNQRDNLADMERKGRARHVALCGESHWKAKLTERQVKEIRDLYQGGCTQNSLAKMFGVGQNHVSRIVRGENWKGV